MQLRQPQAGSRDLGVVTALDAHGHGLGQHGSAPVECTGLCLANRSLSSNSAREEGRRNRKLTGRGLEQWKAEEGKAGSLHLMATSGPKRQPPADPGSRAELGEAVRRDSSHRREKVTSAVAPGTSSYSSKQSKQHCHTLDPEVPCQVPYRGISRPGSSRGDSSALCLPTSRTQKLPARSPTGASQGLGAHMVAAWRSACPAPDCRKMLRSKHYL